MSLIEWRNEIHPEDRSSYGEWVSQRETGTMHFFRLHLGGGNYLRLVCTIEEVEGVVSKGRAWPAPENIASLLPILLPPPAVSTHRK